MPSLKFDSSTLQLIVFLLVIATFYIPLVYLASLSRQRKQIRTTAFRAIVTNLERNQDDKDSVPELFVIYKRLLERFSLAKDTYRSAVEMMEDFLFRSDYLSPDNFKSNYNFEVSQEHRKRVMSIIALMKQTEPFASVSSKYSGLLNMISHALHTNNEDWGKSMLDQMADDVEIMERTIYSQQRANVVAIIVSAVGVILTLVFGVITILPLIFPNK